MGIREHPLAAVAGIALLVGLGAICLVPSVPAGQCPLIRPASGNQFVVGTPIEVEFEEATNTIPPILPGANFYYQMGVIGQPPTPVTFYYREFLDPREFPEVIERHIISRNSGTFLIENRFVINSSEMGICDGNQPFHVIGGPPIPPRDGSVYPLPTPVVDPEVRPTLTVISSYVPPGSSEFFLRGVLTKDGSLTYLPDMIIRNEGTAELKLYDLLIPVGGEACRIEPMVSIAGVTLQPGQEVRVPFVIIRRPDLLNGSFGMYITPVIYSNEPYLGGFLALDDRIGFGVWNTAADVPAGLVPTPSAATSIWEMYE